ncbi:hypothetical protein ACFZBU_47805 [Embleya sp. NPDC008237]|uniref:hypothetical protein n=1 Tax=Embleya sp. NPDC008237 TaxID=3363978 RepID=UPI0036E865E1
MPSQRELPPGNRRDFVEEIHSHYRTARRPALRAISDHIEHMELRSSVSKETIRRMLAGLTVPTRWVTVETVFLALCDLSGTNPNDSRWSSYNNLGDDCTLQEELERRWHQALDDPPPPPPINNGWAEEPPF